MEWKCKECKTTVYDSFKPKTHWQIVIRNGAKYSEICFGELELQLNVDEFLKQFKNIQEKSFDLVKHKNNDYGFSFIEDGYEGVLIRMSDKMNRLRTLSSGVKKEVDNENLKDTIMDLQNYCAIALICLNNNLHSPLFSTLKEEK